MIKVQIVKDGVSIVLDSDAPASEIKTIAEQALELYLQTLKSSPKIPFTEDVKIKNIEAVNENAFTEEELSEIEEARQRSQTVIEAKDEVLAKAEEARIKRQAEEDAAKAEAEKAKAEAEKAKADEENEKRKERAKARRKRQALRNIEKEDGPLNEELQKEEDADKAEAEADKAAQFDYDKKYAKIEGEYPETKTETTTVVEEQKKETTKNEVVKEKESTEKTETTEESQEEDPIEKVKEIMKKQNDTKGSLEEAIKKSMKALENRKDLSISDKVLTIMLETQDTHKTMWNLMVKRGVIHTKFNISKAEAQEVIKNW